MFSNIDRPLFPNFPWLFLPIFSKHLRKHGAEAWTMKCVEKNIWHEEGSVLEPCIRRCPDDETTIWAMEQRFHPGREIPNEPWRHWYPTSHSPATYLTQVDILQS